jgi:DNA polymerase
MRLPKLHIEQLRDTMIQAAYWGLPLQLSQAADIITPDQPKDAEGHRLMLQMCKPRSLDVLTGEATWWHEDDPEKFDKLVAYCEQDVIAERLISRRLLPIPPSVQAEWVLDQQINERGVGLDLPTIHHMIGLAETAKRTANHDLNSLTFGEVPTINATAKLLLWCQNNGWKHDNLRRDTIEQALDEDGDAMSPLLREALALRLDNAKTSVAKLQRMISGADRDDGRVRGMLAFYGANRTGRWAGRLIMLQNMPRGEFKDNGPVVDALKNKLGYEEIHETVGHPASVVSSGLRACLVPDPGNLFVCADFSQIEARIIAWLAGQRDILDRFDRGDDVYAYTASQVTGKPMGHCGKGTKERDLGKVLVLACGFGQGGPKFQDTAKVQGGLDLTAEEAEEAVRAYRRANGHIVDLWDECDRAMRAIVSGQTERAYVAGGKIIYQELRDMHGRHVLAVLPRRNRCMVYRNVEFVMDPGRERASLSYMGLNQYTRRWERLRTYGGKLAQGLTQATARDVMAEAMMSIDPHLPKGAGIILTVHDELLIECREQDAAQVEWLTLSMMKQRPTWAKDLPIDAESWAGEYYRK